jgi:hypothetical protein
VIYIIVPLYSCKYIKKKWQENIRFEDSVVFQFECDIKLFKQFIFVDFIMCYTPVMELPRAKYYQRVSIVGAYVISRVHISKYLCCALYLTHICACVNKFTVVWTCVPHMNAHKNFRDIQRTRSIRYRLFDKHQKDLRRNIVIVWTYLSMCRAFVECWAQTHSAQHKCLCSKNSYLAAKICALNFSHSTHDTNIY